MAKKLTAHDTKEFISALCAKGKTEEERVKILKDALADALDHPWIDDEAKDSIMECLAKQHKVPYTNMDADYGNNDHKKIEEDLDDD